MSNSSSLSFPLREENIPWNSNIISDRVSNCVLQTVTGRVYILVGKMNLHVNSGKLNRARGDSECVLSSGVLSIDTYEPLI